MTALKSLELQGIDCQVVAHLRPSGAVTVHAIGEPTFPTATPVKVSGLPLFA